MENENKSYDFLLKWLNRVGPIAAAIAAIIGAFSTDKDSTQVISYAIAIVIVLILFAFFIWKKYNKKESSIPDRKDEVINGSITLRGLLPFEGGDALLGRDINIKDFYTLIKSSSFIFGVLRGESGCGKTSFLRAGLVPYLEENNYKPIYIKHPLQRPAQGLKEELLKHSVITSEGNNDIRSDNNLKGKVVVIIDQFEEYFIQRPQKMTFELNELFAQLINNCKFKIVVSIRDDFFADLQNLAPQIEDPTSIRGTYILNNFNPAQAKEVLEASIQSDNTDFTNSLIESIINDLGRNGFIKPPELQLVATHLKTAGINEEDKYKALGGAEGILSSFIKNEIDSNTDPEVAKIILRLMCSENFETKSPIDVSLEHISNNVNSKKGNKQSQADHHINLILNRLIGSRIIIESSENNYNLVHDYLAPLIRNATYGLETQKEWANRILKQYIAEFKSDNSFRIPLNRYFKIKKFADESTLNFGHARKLMRKSLLKILISISLPICFFIVFISSVYIFLGSSYYLSTQDAEYIGGTSKIVLRQGNSNVKFLPFYDQVIVDTDFEVGDILDDSVTFKTDIPREYVNGFNINQNGLDNWIWKTLPNLNIMEQIETLRLIGQSDSALMLMADNLDQNSYPAFAHSATNLKLSDELLILEVIKKQYIDNQIDEEKKVIAYTILSELAYANSDFSELVLSNDFLTVLEMMKKEREFGDNLDFYAYDAFRSLIVTNPDKINSEVTDSLISILKYNNNSFLHRKVAYSLGQLALLKPKLMNDEIVETISDYGMKNGGWIREDMFNSLEKIFAVNPSLLKPKLINQFIDSTLITGTKYNLTSFGLPLSAIISPNSIDEGLIKSFEEYNADDILNKAVIDIIIARLTSKKTAFFERKQFDNIANIITSQDEKLDGLKYEAVISLCELVKSGTIERIKPALFEEITNIYNNKDAISGIDNLPEAISIIGQKNQASITDAVFNNLFDAIENSTWTHVPGNAAKALLYLSYVKPDYILKNKDKILNFKSLTYSDGEELYKLLQMAIANASYMVVIKESEEPLNKLFTQLQIRENRIQRVLASCGLFRYCLDNTDSIKSVKTLLQPISISTNPEIRMAANQTLEMIELIEAIKNYEIDERIKFLNTSINEIRSIYTNDFHLLFAMQVILRELKNN